MVYKAKTTTVEQEMTKDLKNMLDWIGPDMRMMASLVDAAGLDLEVINETDAVMTAFETLESKLRDFING